ncbi:MAG: AraC family transcriptional regulator [Bacteroidota bacterium]
MMFSFLRTKDFGTLEMFQAEQATATFPVHFHETFCISLIEQGTFIENDAIATQNSLLISHPFEVHQNKVLPDGCYSLKTLYVSPDMLRCKGVKLPDLQISKIIDEQNIVQQYRQLLEQFAGYLKNTRNHLFERDLLYFLTSLCTFQQPRIELLEMPAWVEEVKKHIANFISQKIQLDTLTKLTGQDKYQFIRNFKRYVGLTPFQFIVLQRVLRGKEMLQEGTPIVDAALDTGFYDQSNFTNYFRRYLGITPSSYQRSCNIFQE